MPGKLIPQTWVYDPTIHAPPKYKRACRYEAYVPAELGGLTFALEGSISGLVSEAEARILELNAQATPVLRPLARLLLRTESIASSKVEGMQLGARELARAEARSDAGNKVGSVATEIIANINAMELAIEDAALVDPFSVQQILEIHARLMETGPTGTNAGVLRDKQNWIGGNDYNPCGADFVPPPPEYVAELLDDLCLAINDHVLSPVVQAALVHAQFETIHPFDDGNGRTGRALIHVVLRRRGIAPSYVPPISVVLAGSRARYIEALTAYRFSGVERWIEYFAGVAARAAFVANAYVTAVDDLIDRWSEMLAGSDRPPRSDAAAWAILSILPGYPVITGPIAVAKTDRSKAKVYEGITALESAGVLLPLTGAKRNQAWEPAGLIDLITQLEAGVLPDQP